MSREILFRAVSKLNGNWVYGSYVKHLETIQDEFQDFDIYIETLGQFTGLTDKNGTKIFEGDVFEEERDEIRGVVVFENGAFKIKWYGIKTVLKEYGYDDGGWGEIETESFDVYYVDKMEVIGNIYDNPELLKED